MADSYADQICIRLADLVERIQLSGEERSEDLRRQVARADVDPRVLVDLAAEEPTAVGALLTDDLGPLAQRRVVDQESPALAALDVLGGVERQGAQVADGPEHSAAVGGAEGMRCVLDDRQTVRCGDGHDGVHLARNPAVVNHHDGFSARRDGRFDQGFVDVPRIGPDVDEHGNTTSSAQALAVETKAKEGMITSSPGWRSSNKVHISRACVHEVVRNTFGEVVMVSIVLLARCV